MDFTRLIKSVEIDGTEYAINTDFRDILHIFKIFNDPDLLDEEKIVLALQFFYVDFENIPQEAQAIWALFEFINMSDINSHSNKNTNEIPLFDWEKDFNIIIAPINKVLGFDVRSVEYLHWWTFLSAFMEIGECTFSTFVSIRDKLNKGKTLEKYEEKILKDHREDIILKKKVDSVTQSLMDEIMGV